MGTNKEKGDAQHVVGQLAISGSQHLLSRPVEGRMEAPYEVEEGVWFQITCPKHLILQ